MTPTRKAVPAGALTTSGKGPAPDSQMALDEPVAIKVYTGGTPKDATGDTTPAAEKAEAEDKPQGEATPASFTGMSPSLAKFAAGLKLPQ